MESCDKCHAHDSLRNDLYNSNKQNEIEHTRILTALNWMKIIGGAWIVVVLAILKVVYGTQTQQLDMQQDITKITQNSKLLADVLIKLSNQHDDYYELKVERERWRGEVNNELERLHKACRKVP